MQVDTQTIELIKVLKKGAKIALWLVGLFSFVINILMLVLPLYMLQVYDRVLASFSGATLLYLTLIAVFMLMIFGALTAVRTHLLIHLSHWLDGKMSTVTIMRSMDELLRQNPYATQSLADLLMVRNFISSQALTTLFDAPWVPIFILIIFLLNPWLGLLAIVAAISLFTCAYFNQKLTQKHTLASKQNASIAQAQYDIMKNNPDTIQGMGMLHSATRKWSKHYNESLADQNVASKRGGEVLALSKFLRILFQVLMLGGGAYFVITSNFTSGMMIAGTILLGRALAPVEQAIGAWQQVILARAAYGRLKQYMLTPKLRQEVENLPVPKGVFCARNIIFKLPGHEKPIVNDVSFDIGPGQLLVIAGPSAAGKTTLAKMIIGVLPSQYGSLRLDGADIFQWARHEVGGHIGYLSQQPELLVGTVRENIARMQEGRDEEVMAATAFSLVHQTILQLPQGYDTMMSNGGRSLSGGQRQQIALARALFGFPTLIVLDEPTTALDADYKQKFMQSLHELKKLNKTVIIVSHQPEILQIADRILVLQAGRTLMYGPGDQVLEKLQSKPTAGKKE